VTALLDFTNRVRKNARHLMGAPARHQCYRVYDRDIPNSLLRWTAMANGPICGYERFAGETPRVRAGAKEVRRPRQRGWESLDRVVLKRRARGRRAAREDRRGGRTSW
jgi:hypothetical protein